jgi:cob(I)alamin adenosyltransferase
VAAQTWSRASPAGTAATTAPAVALGDARRQAMKPTTLADVSRSQLHLGRLNDTTTSTDHCARCGCVHVYTGEGKGKTTAAMGLALRALGHDRRVFIGQFMKSAASGEVKALECFDRVDVEQFGGSGWVLPHHQVASVHADLACGGLARASEALRSGSYDLVILDEIDVAISCGLLTTKDCLGLLDARPGDVELVLTGRWAPQALIDRADLVTEMREVKHYYRQGTAARAGIEY